MVKVDARWVWVSTMPEVVGGVGRWRYSSGGVVDFFLAISSGLTKRVVEDIRRRLKDLQPKNRGNRKYVAMREDDMGDVFVVPRVMFEV